MKDTNIIKAIGCGWALGATVSVALTGVVIWAIIKFVIKFAS